MRPSLAAAVTLVFKLVYARIHGQLTVMIRGQSEPYHLVRSVDCMTDTAAGTQRLLTR